MADVLALRAEVRDLTVQLCAAKLFLSQLHGQNMQAELLAQEKIVADLINQQVAAELSYRAAVLADPMSGTDSGLPLVLLPVRVETAYLPTAAGMDLVVRIYPDDIHVDTHEPELTAAELAAGTAYWQAIWGAGSNQARLDAAWNLLLGQLKPSRAAWAVHALTPAVPRPADETPADQTQPVPPLPTVPTRTGTFTRAARTTLLPDHWHVIAFRNNAELFNVDGSPIPDSLNLSFGPPGTEANSSSLPFDDACRWLVDLDAAIAVGMAVRIALPGPDLAVDQLFVLGVCAQIAPADAASRLQSAFLAHQYTNGLGFLPPGTPTNNTPASRSAWQSAPQPPTPSEIETARSTYQPASSQNAALTATALGLDGTEALSIADNGLLDQQSEVMTLQKQLWNALEGSTLSILYNQWIIPDGATPDKGSWQLQNNADNTAMLLDHVLNWVRSRGNLPTLRVGNQPYGLLPVSSLADWVAPADPTAPLVVWLRNFQPYFLAAVASTPRILLAGDPDPDSTVANVLHRLPVSQTIMLRENGDPWGRAEAGQSLPVAPVPGLPLTSELFYSAPTDQASPMPVPIVGDGKADQGLLQQWLTLMTDCIAMLDGDMTAEQLTDKYRPLFATGTFPGAPPPDLFTALIQDSFTNPLNWSDPDSPAPALFEIALENGSEIENDPNAPAEILKIMPGLKRYADRFAQVCALDADQFDPIVRELLDIASHRFDAWVTSLYARRLADLRTSKPTGIVVGAYGWVEDLSRTEFVTAPPLPGFDVLLSDSRQKYIHAPSLHHAATAAVLRAGFDSHPHPQALAVNLESARVRKADWLAAGVNQGQSVGAMLGYRLERGLHDAQLDAFIETLRKQHPLPLPQAADQDANGPGARTVITTRSTVDGLDCVKQADSVIALFPAENQPAVAALLADLEDVLDAFGDLLLAESVHQLVGGNPLRAGMSADMVGRGEQIPDRFDVIRTPRGGRPLTWQVGAVLAASWRAKVTGWQTDRPRALLEPHADAWIATMLGNASLWQIACNVTSTEGTTSALKVGLDSLHLCALDVIAEFTGENSVFERRIIDTIRPTQPDGSGVTVITAPSIDGSLGFAELASLAARIQSILAQASPLNPQHLQGSDASPTLGLDVNELASRTAVLQSSLSSATAQLVSASAALNAAAPSPADVAAMRSALLQLADIGVTLAYPTAVDPNGPAAITTLGSQGAAVLETLGPLALLAPPPSPSSGAASSELLRWLKASSDYVQSIVGKSFALLPSFLLPADSAYAAALASDASPIGADTSASMIWLRRVARIRPNIAAFHDLLLVSESLTASQTGITNTQLPLEKGAPWVGLPFAEAAPPKARLAMLAATPAPIDVSTTFCGLLFDSWTEQLPGLTSVADPVKGYESAEVTGVAFTVEAPAAYPPQAILLALAPDPAKVWSLDVLLDVVMETLNLAKMRTVDLGDLPRLGRVLPALHSGASLDKIFTAAKVP